MMFPFDKIDRDSDIVIYGAGEAARDIISQVDSA